MLDQQPQRCWAEVPRRRTVPSRRRARDPPIGLDTAQQFLSLGVDAADISTSTRTDAQLRKENAELRRALHRLRADAKIIADAHEKLRVRCSTLEQVAREDAKIIQDERDARDRLRAELERLRQNRADDDPAAKPRASAATSWF